MSEIGVVHLVWARLGVEPFRRFLASYESRRSGAAHRLLVVFNGFGGEAELAAYRALLGGLDCRTLFLPRPVQDIPAYFAAVRAFPYEHFCFLNSHSILLCDDWLGKLRGHLRAGIGAVGATGTYESLHTRALAVHNVTPFTYARDTLGRLRRGLRPFPAAPYWKEWRLLRLYRRHFPPFPNPHLRTNAFLMARELLLRLRVGRIESKEDAMKFESGNQGLTRQLAAMKLRALVVGRDGRAYEKESWRESHTFRSGEQENLLVSDNRTREYQSADPATRAELYEATWAGRHARSAGAPDEER
ncbi:MAG TPA: hypothetical protein VF546_13845 [Pyrinomonadaceae bacterium]|jgi:hypothetical protein